MSFSTLLVDDSTIESYENGRNVSFFFKSQLYHGTMLPQLLPTWLKPKLSEIPAFRPAGIDATDFLK